MLCLAPTICPSTFDFEAPQPIKVHARIRIMFVSAAGRTSFASVSRAGSPWRRPRSAELPHTRCCKMKPVARRKRRTPQIFLALKSAKCRERPGRKVGMLPLLTFLPATSQRFNTRSGNSKAKDRAPVVGLPEHVLKPASCPPCQGCCKSPSLTARTCAQNHFRQSSSPPSVGTG